MIQEYLTELHTKAYKINPLSGCATRSQLLFLALKNIKRNSKIIRYYVAGEKNKDADDRKKLVFFDNHKYPSHVVVELDGHILDSNLDHPVGKKLYESALTKKTGEELESVAYFHVDKEACKQYALRFQLEKFYFLFRKERKLNPTP